MGPRTLSSVAAFALALPVAADVLHVGATGAFPEIQPAIDAAQPGDTILVAPGSYASFTLSKPVFVVGAGPDLVSVGVGFLLSLHVQGITAGTEAVISGLRVSGADAAILGGIVVENCAGTVVLHDVRVEDALSRALSVAGSDRVIVSGALITGGSEAALVVESSELWIASSTILGASWDGPPVAFPGWNGVRAKGATLRLWDTHVEGGAAGSGLLFGPPTGGHGLVAEGSLVQIYGGGASTLLGGDGGTDTGSGTSEAGGTALVLLDGSTASVQASTPILGGVDGSGAIPAPDVDADGSSSFGADAAVYPLLVPSDARASIGADVDLFHGGNPGATQLLFASFGAGAGVDLAAAGADPILDPDALFDFGSVVLDGAGSGASTVPIPPFTGLIGRLPHFQVLELGGAGPGFSNPAFVRLGS